LCWAGEEWDEQGWCRGFFFVPSKEENWVRDMRINVCWVKRVCVSWNQWWWKHES